jgi:hypothetical protein
MRDTGPVQVESVEVVGAVVRCVAASEKAPGLVATADVCREGSRLVVTALSFGQDQHTDFGSVCEVTNDHLRLLTPTAVVRALTDYLAEHPSQELLAWFKSVGSETGMTTVAHVETARQLTKGAESPRRAGRPPKFNSDELVHWTTVCIRLDAARPRSLHDAIAQEMRNSGQELLAHSTKDNARDLLRTLREHGYLEPARKGGARDPLVPGQRCYLTGVDDQ